MPNICSYDIKKIVEYPKVRPRLPHYFSNHSYGTGITNGNARASFPAGARNKEDAMTQYETERKRNGVKGDASE